VRFDRSLWAWGGNSSGQLGDGTTIDRELPIAVGGPLCDQVAAGSEHSLALAIDGTVWAWGLNTDGQLGDGTTVSRSAPYQLTSVSAIIAVAAGSAHSVALKSDGTVWAWGLNANGQLGDNSTTQRTAPVQVRTDASSLLTEVVAIAAGDAFSLALKSDGTVWAWGLNTNGQLGDNSTVQRNVATQVKTAASTYLTGITAIAAGASHSLALKSDGYVWGWGLNANSQLGATSPAQRTLAYRLSSASNVAAIAAGAAHSLALKADGAVWAWGLNTSGQLGDGTMALRSTPTAIPGLAAVAAIAAGGHTSLAICSDRSVRQWGSNARGQIGTPVLSRSLVGICLMTSPTDSDADGLPDVWETANFERASLRVGTDDPDADGLSNLHEYLLGTDPTRADADGDSLTDPVDPKGDDYFNDIPPGLSVVGGDNQSTPVTQFNAAPFTVRILGTTGAPLANAPVTFTVVSGGGQLATTNTGSPTMRVALSLRTAVDGTVQVFYQQPVFASVVSRINVSAGTAQLTIRTTSSGAVGDEDSDDLPDTWETTHFGGLTETGGGDYDSDGFTNLEEYVAGTDPTVGAAPDSVTLLRLQVWTPLK
jgi:alpha-tubulin suppressor-like RCC1 family protein